MKETEGHSFQCPLFFAEVNMSLFSSGLCCSWHRPLPLLCSQWLMTFRCQIRQKPGNCGSQAAGLCPARALRMARTSQGGLLQECPAACGKTGREMFGLDGKVDCPFVWKLLNLPTCTSGVFSPLKCFSEERSAPTWLYCVSLPVANCCWKALLLDGEI